jgi:hypothetical protein
MLLLELLFSLTAVCSSEENLLSDLTSEILGYQ